MKKIVRLDKYLADMGIGTRSEVKKLIKSGKVKVNNEKVSKESIKVDIDNDIVEYDGNLVKYVEYEYYMLNKPSGYVSATTDSSERTVVELIKDNINDLFPVGRLDKDTEGLLLLTNDGELAHKLLSPSKHVDKTYYAEIDGIVEEKNIQIFREGLNINNEYETKPALLEILEVDRERNTSKIKITITEGKYHQVKRMFKAIGTKVVYLKRISMGSLMLDDSLKLGEYRKLTSEEIAKIKQEKI